MAIELNHTIVASRDKHSAAASLAALLGLPAPSSFGPFQVVALSNGVSLDFLQTAEIHRSTTPSSSPRTSSTTCSGGSGSAT